MASIPLHYIDLRVFVYATEDESRVHDALATFLPDEWEVERQVSEGHFGDRILVLSTRIELADDIRYVLEQIGTIDEFDQLRGELDERVTENCEFYLRFDKQAAYNGSVQLGPGITFRAKVEAYPAKRSKAIENAQEVLEDIATGAVTSD